MSGLEILARLTFFADFFFLKIAKNSIMKSCPYITSKVSKSLISPHTCFKFNFFFETVEYFGHPLPLRTFHLESCSRVALKSCTRKTSRHPLVSLQTFLTALIFNRLASLSPPVPSELLFFLSC